MCTLIFTSRYTSINKSCWQSPEIIVLWICWFIYLRHTDSFLDIFLLLLAVVLSEHYEIQKSKTKLQEKTGTEKCVPSLLRSMSPFVISCHSTSPLTYFSSDLNRKLVKPTNVIILVRNSSGNFSQASLVNQT